MAELLTIGASEPTGNKADSDSLSSRYERMATSRDSFLEAARAASELTIPSLFPPEGVKLTQLRKPFQSVGSRGVNNLASKLLLALLPPNQPFYREEIDELLIQQLLADEGGDSQDLTGELTELKEALGRVEKAVLKEAESLKTRPNLFQALRQLVVGGNVLVVLPLRKNEEMRVFSLQDYVILRDPTGKVLEIITKESKDPRTLDPKVQEQIKGLDGSFPDEARKTGTVDLFTGVRLQPDGRYLEFQEIAGVPLDGTFSVHNRETFPYIPLRFFKVDGHSYSPSYVEEYSGDLQSLEALSQAMVEGSAAASRAVFMVDPAGTTRKQDIATARNLDVINGLAQDVSTLQLEKFADFQVVIQEKQTIEARLNAAFLLNSSVQRQAERVTAEEIRFVAQELEDALGGIYSLLADEVQLPMVGVLKHRMVERGSLPKLPKDIIKPRIVAGFDALGRAHDFQNLNSFLSVLASTLGPEAIIRFLHGRDIIVRFATALGINTEGMLKSEEELATDAQQQQMLQLAEQLGPNAVTQIGEFLRERQQPNA